MNNQDDALAYVIPEAERHELRDEIDPASLVEISDLNPNAQRVRGDVWNEHELPVMEWEAAEHRVVLPADLRESLGIDAPALRWAASTRSRVLSGRPAFRDHIKRIDHYLANWQYVEGEPTLDGS